MIAGMCSQGGRAAPWPTSRTATRTSPTATTTAPTGSTTSSWPSAGRHRSRAWTSTASTTTAPTSSSAWATTATPSPRSWAPTTIGSVRYRVQAVLTNKNQQGAYRGFGSEVNNWMLEQIVDKAARELGHRPGRASAGATSSPEFPHFIPTGNVYDSGDYDARPGQRAGALRSTTHWRAGAGGGPGGGPLHRHRADHRAGALGLLGHRVLVPGSTSRALRSPRCPRA